MESYKKAVGSRIRRRRKEMGFKTQAALAKKLGIDQPRVNKWETGANMPDSAHRALLCEVLQMNEGDLISIEQPTTNERAELITKIITLLPALNDIQLSAMLDIANLSQFSTPSTKRRPGNG